MDLWGGQADALVLVHRLEHVVDELLDSRRSNLAGIERARGGAKHGVSHARYLQNRHAGIIVVRMDVVRTGSVRHAEGGCKAGR